MTNRRSSPRGPGAAVFTANLPDCGFVETPNLKPAVKNGMKNDVDEVLDIIEKGWSGSVRIGPGDPGAGMKSPAIGVTQPAEPDAKSGTAAY